MSWIGRNRDLSNSTRLGTGVLSCHLDGRTAMAHPVSYYFTLFKKIQVPGRPPFDRTRERLASGKRRMLATVQPPT
jgi:hypothetical protein